jgi:hypothetical protein
MLEHLGNSILKKPPLLIGNNYSVAGLLFFPLEMLTLSPITGLCAKDVIKVRDAAR